jgi:hypothetical protein
MTYCGNIFRSILDLSRIYLPTISSVFIRFALAVIKSIPRKGGGFGSWQGDLRGVPEKAQNITSYSPY